MGERDFGFESVYELLDKMWHEHGRSLTRIQSYLEGYRVALISVGKDLRDVKHFYKFPPWVAKRLGYPETEFSWSGMILERTSSEEEAFFKFFELLQEFKKEVPID